MIQPLKQRIRMRCPMCSTKKHEEIWEVFEFDDETESACCSSCGETWKYPEYYHATKTFLHDKMMAYMELIVAKILDDIVKNMMSVNILAPKDEAEQ